MNHKCFALAACLLLSPAALAQTPKPYEPPRTREGRPDFHGVWATSFLTGLERPDGAKTLVVPAEEAPALSATIVADIPKVIDPDFHIQNIGALSTVRGEIRSSLLVEPADGRMPYTEKALKLVDRDFWMNMEAHDNPEERSTFDRCLAGLGQPPIRQIPAMIPSMFIQTERELVIVTEDVASLRVVHLDGRPPPPAAVTSYEGWSSGRWEGDTLVVTTTHVRADDSIRGTLGRPVLVEPDSRLTERFTRIGPDELLYQFTVEDSDLYTAPLKVEYSFRLQDTIFYEYACHEANYSMVNILLAGRVADAKPKTALKK